MKESKTIEQQVAELTEEQKNTVVKVGKYGTIILLALTLPAILLMCLGLLLMITQPTLFSEMAYKGFLKKKVIVRIAITFFFCCKLLIYFTIIDSVVD